MMPVTRVLVSSLFLPPCHPLAFNTRSQSLAAEFEARPVTDNGFNLLATPNMRQTWMRRPSRLWTMMFTRP